MSRIKNYKDNGCDIRENDTLHELVKVSEQDGTTGVAGFLILNPDKRDTVVELGAFIRWNLDTWQSYLRNSYISERQIENVIELDYVAACSALFRTEALVKSGIMDERYFLHWDDIDLLLRIKKIRV